MCVAVQVTLQTIDANKRTQIKPTFPSSYHSLITSMATLHRPHSTLMDGSLVLPTLVLFLIIPDAVAHYVMGTHLSSAVAAPRRSVTSVMSVNKRVNTVFCDDVHSFFCTGAQSCFTGLDGYVGCCSVSSCMARTCMDYTPRFSTTCDYSTGGCAYCSDPASPYCATVTNVVASQHIHFCRSTRLHLTLSYVNALTTGFVASDMTSKSPSPAQVTSPTPEATSLTLEATVGTSGYLLSSSSSSTELRTPTRAEETTAMNTEIGSAGPQTSVAIEGADTVGHGASGGSAASPKLIAGIVVGTAGGITLLLLLAYLFKKHFSGWCCACFSPNRRRPTFHKGNTDTPDDRFLQSAGRKVEGTDEASSDKVAIEVKSTLSASGRPKYHISNPDIQPVEDTTTLSDLISTVSGLAEAPTDRHVQSPLISELGSPISVHSSPSFQVSPIINGHFAPVTPPQQSTRERYVPYTPSAYTPDGQAPSSLARSYAPAPNLPQEYSLAELEGAFVNKDSQEARYRMTPFLSAEDALGGGWKNEGDETE